MLSSPRLLTLLILSLLIACAGEPDRPSDTGGDDHHSEGNDSYASEESDQDHSPGDGDEPQEDNREETSEEPSDPLACAPLPPPEGTIVEVTPADTADLPQMVRSAAANTTFLFAPGTYDIPNTLHIRADGITFRSSDDDPESVIIDGRYEVNSLIFINASDVTIAHLTLTRALHHPIHITPTGEATEHVTDSLIYDVQIFDGAQQFIKVNGNSSRTAFVDQGRLECSYFELTDAGRPFVDRSATGCYTGGIDAHGARDWIVRNNTFVDIYCAGEGLAEHAVHFWTGARDTLVENNTIINCARGIGFGLTQTGTARTYEDDPYPDVEGFIGHYDGLIRNNIIYADIPWYDTGIELAQAPGTRVYHNTIYTPDAENAFSSIDYRFANTDVIIQNNLTARITRRNDARGLVSHNLESIGPDLFVDVDNLDFRLRPTADEAIDQGIEVPDAGIDIEGKSRHNGDAPDIGAHEL